jgi:hypothetical protein
MLGKQVVVLSNVFVVEIGDAEVKDDVEKKGEIKKREILSVIFIAHNMLHPGLNAQYPKGFNEKIEKK